MAQPGMSARRAPRWHCFESSAALVATVAAQMLERADAAIAARGRFTVVLAGGSTPAALYRRLATTRADWARWWIFFGDERCLAAGDAERNDAMARSAWLDRVPLPPSQLLAMPAELGPEAGARRYSQSLAPFGTFDLVLLGLGEDGHTASLFPGQTLDGAPALPVRNAPKPPPERISLSAARLADAHAVWFLVAGASKAEALRRWHAGDDLPAASIQPAGGVDLFTDIDPR